MFDSLSRHDVYRIRDHGHDAGRRRHRRDLGGRRGARMGGPVRGGPGRVGCRSRPRDALVRRHAGDSLGGHRPPLLQPRDRPGRDGTGHRGGRRRHPRPVGAARDQHVPAAVDAALRAGRLRGLAAGAGLEPFDQQDRIVRAEGAATTDPVRSERELHGRARPARDRGRVVAVPAARLPAGHRPLAAAAGRPSRLAPVRGPRARRDRGRPRHARRRATASPGWAWTARCRGS